MTTACTQSLTFTDATLDAGHAVVTAAGGYRIGLLPNMLKAMLATRVNAEAPVVKDCLTAAEAAAVPKAWAVVESATCFQLRCGNEVVANLVGPNAQANAATLAQSLSIRTALEQVVQEFGLQETYGLRLARAALAAQPKADSTEPTCPDCHGSGEGTAMEGRGPDTHEVTTPCPKCGGSGVAGSTEPKAAYRSIMSLQDCADAESPSPVDPASTQAGEEWQDMATAPKDGTLLRLLVAFEEHATEDGEGPQPTIGSNTYDNHHDFDEWQFAGWNWEQDCYTQGVGKPVGWLPILALRPKAQPLTDEQVFDLARKVNAPVGCLKFSRAIEAYYGIASPTKGDSNDNS